VILQMRTFNGDHFSKWQTVNTTETGLLDQYALERIFDNMNVKELNLHFKEGDVQEWRRPSMRKFYRVSKIEDPHATPKEVGRLPFNDRANILVTTGSPAYNLMVAPGSYLIELAEEPDV
jgi:hypothetical protein